LSRVVVTGRVNTRGRHIVSASRQSHETGKGHRQVSRGLVTTTM